MLLVGDSLGMVVLGHDTTLAVTMDEMLHHTRAAARGRSRGAAGRPTCPTCPTRSAGSEAVRNAGRFIQEGGADAVKIEGGARRVPLVEALLDAEIPVMGHIGLTPQSLPPHGRLQGAGPRRGGGAARWSRTRGRSSGPGSSSIVLEGMPAELGAADHRGGRDPDHRHRRRATCDGQVLVFHDLLGLGGPMSPRFVRRYAELGREIVQATSAVRRRRARSGASRPRPSPYRRDRAAARARRVTSDGDA